MEMRKLFETQVMRVMVEDTSYTGSAFGTNEDGGSVFFNRRLVERVSLDIGDIVDAHVIPNYEDKRDVTPWRAIRVTVVDAAIPLSNTPAPAAYTVRGPAEIEAEVAYLLGDDDTAYWTTTDLADAIDSDTKAVGNACLRLFNKGMAAKADVHGRPDQERASFCLWARNSEQFR